MKYSANLVGLAVDSVGIFVGMLGWMFMVWLPFFLAFVLFFMTKTPATASTFLLIFVSVIIIPFGLLLKWLSNGIIKRGWVRVILCASVLVLLGIRLGFAYSPIESRGGQPAFDRHLMGIELLSAAGIAILGLTRAARCPHE
jgi:hypothetical protein